MSNYLLNAGSGTYIYQIYNNEDSFTEGNLQINAVSGTDKIITNNISIEPTTISGLYYLINSTKYAGISSSNYTNYIYFSNTIKSCSIKTGSLKDNNGKLSISVTIDYRLFLRKNVCYIHTASNSYSSYQDDKEVKTESIQHNVTIDIDDKNIQYNNEYIFINNTSDTDKKIITFNGIYDEAYSDSEYSVEANISYSFKNLKIPRAAICGNNYTTFILSNAGNSGVTTESFTNASGLGYFYIGLTNNREWRSFDLKNFVTVGIDSPHEVISNVQFNDDFSARNLHRNADFAYYSIPLNSLTMCKVLAQIKDYSNANLGIGALKVNDVFPSDDILSKYTGTIDSYVENLLNNYNTYTGIAKLPETNDGTYDSQLLVYPLPVSSDDRKKLQEKIIKQYKINDGAKTYDDSEVDSSTILSCNPTYNDISINTAFLNKAFNVDTVKLCFNNKDPLDELKTLTTLTYEINAQSPTLSTDNKTFDISSKSNTTVNRYIAQVAAKNQTINGIIKKDDTVALDYVKLYELLHTEANAVINKLENTKLWIYADKLTNTTDDFYYKDNIFAGKGTSGSEVPKRTIDQWIPAKIVKNNKDEYLIAFNSTEDIIQSDGSPENLAKQDSSDKFRSGAGLFDVDKSKITTTSHETFKLSDVLSRLLIKRSQTSPTGEYDITYNDFRAENITNSIISFKFFVYSFGFSWTKFNNDVETCYANKLCFISADDMGLDVGKVKYNFGITKNNIFYEDSKPVVSADNKYIYYILDKDSNGDYNVSRQQDRIKDITGTGMVVGPFLSANDVTIDHDLKYALSKNKRDPSENYTYIYDSFRHIAAFRPFTDGTMTSELEYKNDICENISLDKGFIHDYILNYKDAYTVVKFLDEDGNETTNQFIINAGSKNTDFLFSKTTLEKDKILQLITEKFDLDQANKIINDIGNKINTFSAPILESTLHYSGAQLETLDAASEINNTYVVYKLYVDDTTDKYKDKDKTNIISPVRIDETVFTVNVYPFNRDNRGNKVDITEYITCGTTVAEGQDDQDKDVVVEQHKEYIYSKKFTVTSDPDLVDAAEDYLNYKGIMPALLNKKLSDLSVFNTNDISVITQELAKLKLSEEFFNNVTADAENTGLQAYNAMSLLHVYSEDAIKNMQNYTGDPINEKWWNTLKNVMPLGYNGLRITTSSSTTQNVYIGLEPNLIEKQSAIFAQSVYHCKWYLKTMNNAVIEVYPNETYTFEYIADENTDDIATIRVTHLPGVENAGLTNEETNHELKTINATENEDDDIDAAWFRQTLRNEKYTNVATPEYIKNTIKSKNIIEYISTENTYNCLVIDRKSVTAALTTNGGWMTDPDAIVVKRDDENYPISNEIHIADDIIIKDEDIFTMDEDHLINEFGPKINSLRQNYVSDSSSPNDVAMAIFPRYANPVNNDYDSSIEDHDKRYLGISYTIRYSVPVGTHLTEKFSNETTTVNYVNIFEDAVEDKWQYGNEKGSLMDINLNKYTANIPEKMEKTAYTFKYYKEDGFEDPFDYESNKVLKRHISIQAMFEPISYELYLSYIKDTDKDLKALDSISTEIRTFTYEDTLVNFQKDANGKVTENYLAHLPATKSSETVGDCFYKGHILSDGWYMLPEKIKIKNVIIEDDEFLEKTFGPKSALCYCEAQKYNIYYLEKLPSMIDRNTKFKVIEKQENISYNESITLLSGNDDTYIYGYNELGKFHKILFPEPFAESVNGMISASDLGLANNDGLLLENVPYDPKEFFYGQTARNICGDFSFDEKNKTAKVPNVYLEYMYETNDLTLQIKYNDNSETVKSFGISATDGANVEIINFINTNNDNAGLQYTNNNTNFFNTDKIFRKYKLMHLNEDNMPEQIVFTTGYFSAAPNEFTVTHNDFVQIYSMMLEDTSIYLAPIWESYKYDIEFTYNGNSTTLTLESAKKYVLDIGNTPEYIFNVGDIGSSNNTVDLRNFIDNFTNVNAEIYSYYVGWANTNGVLRYTAGQDGLINLVSISRNSTFDNNRKLTSDKLTLQAFFTKRMTNKNGVIFKEGDHYYCDDTKLMLINISNNGFWAIDKTFS